MLAESDAEAQAEAEARRADQYGQAKGKSEERYCNPAGPLILPVIGFLAAGLHPQCLDIDPAARQGSRWGASIKGIPDHSIFRGPWPEPLLSHATHLQVTLMVLVPIFLGLVHKLSHNHCNAT